MQAERWQEVEKLFHAALGRASHERIAYLREASAGDAELQREVESLLAAHEQTATLETAASHLAQEWLKEQHALVGRTLGHFQVLAHLGSGGMGEVYLAEDNRLRRKVALKLLAKHSIGSEDRLQRFEREALAASALNHPNIVTIHEIDESDGVPFIATEFVEGQTLRALEGRERLDLARALDIVEQVASALEAAHAAGIIHRDIKPENIMVRPDGLVKLLDFGIAKLTGPEPETVDNHTIPGRMIGTVGYMSPEQARGLELDARSDIFSLGVVLYEMIAGQAPFQGLSKSDLIAEILKTEPTPLRLHSPEMPRELENIVSKALHKDRDERFQTVKDLLLDLKGLRQKFEISAQEFVVNSAVPGPVLRWRSWLAWPAVIVVLVAGLGFWLLWRDAPTAVSSEIKSLAVLPVKSLNQETKEDYLGLGIATDIITKVSQSGELTVRPTSAIRKYVNQETDALAAARELKVDAVLESTFLHVGDQLRVSVNLLRVADGASLWAEKFDERFTDIFAIQDKVSQKVTQRLRLRLSPAKQERLSKRHTSNPEAYNYYTKAMYHFWNIGPALRTRPEADLAVELLKKAISLDPNYALAYAQLGNSYARIAVFLEDNPALIELARQELARAESLDPQLAEVHVGRYFIAFSQYEGWQAETAIRELRLAQQLDPNIGHFGLADLYHHVGLEKEAIDEFERALNVDPTDDPIKAYYVGHYLQSARPDEGLAANKRLFNRGPDFRYYVEKRMVKEAIQLAEQGSPHSEFRQINRPLLLALQGKHQEAQAAVPEIHKKLRRNRGYHHDTYMFARTYALGGKSAEALKWLRVTVKEGFPCYPLFARDPFLDPIRKDPAFLQFMAEMKTQWEGYQREFG